jgi:hypothetical protein
LEKRDDDVDDDDELRDLEGEGQRGSAAGRYPGTNGTRSR